jgi:predicted metal-binding protein
LAETATPDITVPDVIVPDTTASDTAAVLTPGTAGVAPASPPPYPPPLAGEGREGEAGGPRSEDELASPSGTARAITIYVCVTCRGGRSLDLEPVPGQVLATATAQAAEGTGIAVRPIRCLANCNRGLSAAVRRAGAWTYVFGNLDPSGGADALIEGAKLFAGAPDGLMPWRGRPDALKRGLVARTPPFDFAGDGR